MVQWEQEVNQKGTNPRFYPGTLYRLFLCDMWGRCIVNILQNRNGHFSMQTSLTVQKLWKCKHFLNGLFIILLSTDEQQTYKFITGMF